MSAPQESKRLPFVHKVIDLINPYGQSVNDLSVNVWRTMISRLSKFDPKRTDDLGEKTRAFMDALKPDFSADEGYVDQIASVIRMENTPYNDGVRLRRSSDAARDSMYVRVYVPFNLDVVQRKLMELAAAKDIERLRWRKDKTVSPITIRIADAQISRLEELQRKLKERVSPTKPSGEREH